MPRKKDRHSKSERNEKDGRKNSHKKHTRQSHDEASRRARDQGSGVDNISANGLLVVQASSRAPHLDQATMAGDRSKGRKSLNDVKARSKKPFHRVEDPDSSDDSSDSATASSDTGSAVFLPSLPLPKPYDGRADQMAFDFWVRRVTTWAKCSKLSHEQVMYMFPHLVSGKAAACFKRYHTPSRYPPIEPSLEGIFRVIHKSCFPPDHKVTLHKELMSATQGHSGVRDFAFELRSRAKHLPYVSKQCLAAIFFAGVRKYIRVGLIMDGMQQGDTDLDTLVERAVEYEDARAMLGA